MLTGLLGFASLACALWAQPGVAAKDIVKGSGPMVQAGQLVTVHFEVRTADGKELANTRKRGLAYSFVLGAAGSPGFWTTGVRGMAIGGERELIVPPEDGYGPDGVALLVPPGATLNVRLWLVKSASP